MLSGHQRRAGVDGVLALCRGDDSVDLVSAGRDGSIILWRNGEAVETLKGRRAQSREALKPAPVTRVHSKVTGEHPGHECPCCVCAWSHFGRPSDIRWLG